MMQSQSTQYCINMHCPIAKRKNYIRRVRIIQGPLVASTCTENVITRNSKPYIMRVGRERPVPKTGYRHHENTHRKLTRYIFYKQQHYVAQMFTNNICPFTFEVTTPSIIRRITYEIKAGPRMVSSRSLSFTKVNQRRKHSKTNYWASDLRQRL